MKENDRVEEFAKQLFIAFTYSNALDVLENREFYIMESRALANDYFKNFNALEDAHDN